MTRSDGVISQNIEIYKQHHHLLQRKLNDLFGCHLYLDISMLEIEANGLRALLTSRVPLCYFLYVLLESLCPETLLFYLEVEKFELTKFYPSTSIKKVGRMLYSVFIEPGGALQINIDQKCKLQVKDEVEKGNRNCFDPAKEQIFGLMEDQFIRFRDSEIFLQMKQELGTGSMYSAKNRNKAIRLLLTHLENVPQGFLHDKVQARSNILRTILHEFCIGRLNVDFVDRYTFESAQPKKEQAKEDTFEAYINSL